MRTLIRVFVRGIQDGKDQGQLSAGWTFENARLDNAYGYGANIGEWLAHPSLRRIPWKYYP